MRFLLSLTFLLFSTSLFSQWSNNPDTNTLVLCRDSVTPFTDARVVADEEGGTIFFSLLGRQGADSVHAILAQKIRKDGFLEWGNEANPVLIMVDSIFHRSLEIIDAAADGNNGAYILFAINRADSEIVKNKVILQHVGASGDLLWGSNGIVVVEADSIPIENVKLCSVGLSGAVVGWEKMQINFILSNYDYAKVFMQKYGFDGTAAWQSNGLEVGGNGFHFNNTVVSDGEGGVIACYSNLDSIGFDVYAQRIDSSGNRVWGGGVPVAAGPFEQSTFIGYRIQKNAVEDETGGVIIAYQNYRDSSGGYPEMRLQRLNGQGAKLWPDTGVLICLSRDYWFLETMISDGPGGAALVTRETKMDSSTTYTYLHRVLADGNIAWNPAGIPVGSEGTYTGEVNLIVKDKSGNFIMPYQGDITNYRFAIKVNKISPEGVHLWGGPNNGLLVSTNKYSVDALNISNGNGDSVIISWAGYRWLAPPYCAFANKLDENGALVNSIFYYTIQDGNWNDPAIWSGGIVPDADAVVILRNNIAVTADASCYTLRIEPPHGNVSINAGINLTVTH